MKPQPHRPTPCHASCATSGSLALTAPVRPQLRVIEGGATARVTPRDLAALRAARRAREAARSRHLLAAAALATLGVCVVLASAFLANSALARERERAFASVETSLVMVHNSDTLWDLAQGHPVEGQSTRAVITWIRERNALESSTIHVGQQLIVPAHAG